MHTSAVPGKEGASERTASFDEVLAGQSCGPLLRTKINTLQMNLGMACNQACAHCHVSAGPNQSTAMTALVAERTMQVLSASPGVDTVDLTGGAPELNPSFRSIVATSKKLGHRVIDRANLTVFLEPEMESTPDLLAEHQVEIVASLPCYTQKNVDAQRGHGTFDKCIQVLKRLNRLGYGIQGSALRLNLVYNPLGEFLPPSQSTLEVDYRKNLRECYGVEFHKLLTITNMPIGRFEKSLRLRGKTDFYLNLLANQFNRSTVANVMCRSLVSVAPDGQLFDCDFNQALRIPISGGARSIWDIGSFSDFDGQKIATGNHCFGCTAGSGSSCRGSLEPFA